MVSGLSFLAAVLDPPLLPFDLAVTSTQLGAGEVPDWYLGTASWADGLGTANFAVLSPVALIALGVAVLRCGALPRWTAAVLFVAAAGVLGQFLSRGGALPFPQFLAFVAIGARLIVRPLRPSSFSPDPTLTPEGA